MCYTINTIKKGLRPNRSITKGYYETNDSSQKIGKRFWHGGSGVPSQNMGNVSTRRVLAFYRQVFDKCFANESI